MFDLGGHGDLLSAEVAGNPEHVNLVAYAVAASPKTLCVTLINREYGPKGKTAEVSVETGKKMKKGEVIIMCQEKGDIAQVEGVTVGGVKFAEDGTWSGNWQPLKGGMEGQKVQVEVPPATAVVLRMENQ